MSWNLPPGCTQAEVDQDDPYQPRPDLCECCGRELFQNSPDDLICLQCDITALDHRNSRAEW